MFIGYLPPKYLMGEVISSHQLPLWNPYISFGLPFYGDMSSGYWNPITWLIAATTGYNPYTLTCEVMLYLFLSGAGMYYLSGLYTNNKYIRLIAALSFMCNGFITGHLQHLNWLSGAAFLPWSLWSLKKMHAQPTLNSICKASIIFYLLASSSHPGIIIGCIYFFLAYVIFDLFNIHKTEKGKQIKEKIVRNILFLMALILLSAGMISGYTDIIPHFERSKEININISLSENTNFSSWISFLLPFSTTVKSGFFSGDIAFRNIYFGLLLFIFFLYTLFIKKTKEQIFFLATGIFFLLLSLGQVFKLLSIKLLPLIGFVRLNAEFRIFSILSFIIVAVISLNTFQFAETAFKKRLKEIIRVISIGLLLLLTLSFISILVTKESFIFKSINPASYVHIRTYLKEMTGLFSLYDAFFIQGAIQFILLYFIRKAIELSDFKKLLIITTADIVIATLLNLPFTGVGKASVAELAHIQQKAPKGIPTPPLQPISENDTITLDERLLFGEWSCYNKQIGTDKLINYPVKLKNYTSYFIELNKDSSLAVSKLPYIFITDTADRQKIRLTENILPGEIKHFSTNKLVINHKYQKSHYIVYLQNYYPHWFYSQQKKNATPVSKAGINFIAIPGSSLNEGDVTIFFNPSKVKTGMLISLITLVLYSCVIIVAYSKKRKRI